jgi:hypothetical protein
MIRRAAPVTHDPGRRLFEHTSRSDDGNPARALRRWQVTPIPDQRSRIEVSWHVAPRTFWRRALLGKLRRRSMGGEVPDSLRALATLLARS